VQNQQKRISITQQRKRYAVAPKQCGTRDGVTFPDGFRTAGVRNFTPRGMANN
jgi:hypothetical protein